MTKGQANQILEFIERHYDYVSQEDYFTLCDMLLATIVDDAIKGGYVKSLVEKYPYFFREEQA